MRSLLRIMVVIALCVVVFGCATHKPPPLKGCAPTLRPINLPGSFSSPAPAARTPNIPNTPSPPR